MTKKTITITNKSKNLKIHNLAKVLGIKRDELEEQYTVYSLINKIEKFRNEIQFFENKYNKSFSEFIQSNSTLPENYEYEDDINDWEYAITNLEYYRKLAISISLNV